MGYTSAKTLHAVLAVIPVVTLFAIIGLGIGALPRNQIVAVVVGLISLLIVENILAAIPTVRAAWAYTPNGASQAILNTGGDSGSGDGVALLSGWAGVVVLLVWAFVPAVLGTALTLNRDIT